MFTFIVKEALGTFLDPLFETVGRFKCGPQLNEDLKRFCD